jgi:hypothetical protein
MDGADSKPITDEYAKSGVVRCVDGTFAFGFAGLATLRGFSMNSWLIDRIRAVSTPSCRHRELIQGVARSINATFETIPGLRELAPTARRLTIVFLGYFFDSHDIYGREVLISNHEDFSPGAAFGQRRSVGEFIEYPYTQDPAASGEFFNVTALGNWRAVKKNQVEAVNKLAMKFRDRNAVVAKAIKILRMAASTPDARNNIGRQIDEIFIPHDPKESPISRYHTSAPTNRVWVPPFIDVSGDTTSVQRGSVLIATPRNGVTNPWLVPEVSANRPCPCRSGLRYRECHGQPGSRTIVDMPRP